MVAAPSSSAQNGILLRVNPAISVMIAMVTTAPMICETTSCGSRAACTPNSAQLNTNPIRNDTMRTIGPPCLIKPRTVPTPPLNRIARVATEGPHQSKGDSGEDG